MNQPKIICKNVWKLYGPDPKKFLPNTTATLTPQRSKLAVTYRQSGMPPWRYTRVKSSFSWASAAPASPPWCAAFRA